MLAVYSMFTTYQVIGENKPLKGSDKCRLIHKSNRESADQYQADSCMGLLKNKPQINADESKLNELSEKIIGAAFEVSNILGVGFLEKVYENALNVELKLRGLQAQ